MVGFAALRAIRYAARLPGAQVGFAAAFGLSVVTMHGTYYFAISRMPSSWPGFCWPGGQRPPGLDL